MTSAREQIKKAGERLYLDKFMALSGWSASIEDSEPPDFVVRSSDVVIGVELTELLKSGDEVGGSSAKRSEKQRSAALRSLATKYYQAGGKPIYLKALWPHNPRGHLPDELVAILIQVRDQLAVGKQERVCFGPTDVYYVTALPPDFGAYSRWVCISDAVGWVSSIPNTELEKVIQAKSQRLPSYRSKVDRVILLIVANQMTNAGRWRLATGLSSVERSGFDEIHLLMYPDETRRIDRGTAF